VSGSADRTVRIWSDSTRRGEEGAELKSHNKGNFEKMSSSGTSLNKNLKSLKDKKKRNEI
jgi:hypothetical protein